MTTSSTTRSLQKAIDILTEAIEADERKEWEIANDRYTKAFEEFKKILQPYYKSAALVKKKLNLESTTAEFALGPADSPSKLSPVKFSGGKLDDVGGLGVCKEVLKEATIWPKKYPQLFTGNRKPWRAVLLYGPPGSGKTLLAMAIADEAKFPLLRWNVAKTFTRVLSIHGISPSDIVSKWMGDSEKQVKNIFQVAREKEPSIVFIDEIDSLCGQRGENNENEASRRIKSELLLHMQEVCDGVKDVLILAATNTPFALDQAIRRRFDKRIYVHLPDKEARKHIFKVRIGKTLKTISEKEFDKLANNTEGFSSSDISYFVKDALCEVVRATLTNEFFKRSGEKLVPCKRNEKERVSLQEIDENGENSKIKVPPCTAAHFEKVRGNQKATVTKDDLKRFDEFTEKFGIYG